MFYIRQSINVSTNLNSLFAQNITFLWLVLIQSTHFFQQQFESKRFLLLMKHLATVTMKSDKVFLQQCFFYPLAKDPNHGVEIRQNLFLLFLLPLIIYLNGFNLFSLFNFSKIPLIDSLDIQSLGTSLKNHIKQFNLSVIKRTAIIKEHLYGCFCE